MRKAGILNTEICRIIAALGHTDYLVIADPGLPIPETVPVIDISLVNGVPGFAEVLDAVAEELIIDSYQYAGEMEENSVELLRYIQKRLPGVRSEKMSHVELKKKVETAKAVIRTGQCTPYANIILEGGVGF